MAKEFDVQVLNTTIVSVVQDTFRKMLRVELLGQPAILEKDIIEYDSRMRVFPQEKFNGPTYISFVNFFLSEKDLAAANAVGTFVLFVKEDIAEKVLKAFGLSSRDAEEESVLMDKLGEFCFILADALAKRLVELGYAGLIVSPPYQTKNSVPEGVPFDYGLYSKQELSFTVWNQKCIVVEACMGHVPQK